MDDASDQFAKPPVNSSTNEHAGTEEDISQYPSCPASIVVPEGAKTRIVTLCNERGLHARASAKFATLAQSFEAKIIVSSLNDVCLESVEGDAIMDLLLLGSACGEGLHISALGEDADAALDALCALVENRFGEEK